MHFALSRGRTVHNRLQEQIFAKPCPQRSRGREDSRGPDCTMFSHQARRRPPALAWSGQQAKAQRCFRGLNRFASPTQQTQTELADARLGSFSRSREGAKVRLAACQINQITNQQETKQPFYGLILIKSFLLCYAISACEDFPDLPRPAGE